MRTATQAAPRADGELLSADQAAVRLGVRKATLYAYVSRGLVTALPDPRQPQRSRYAAVQLDRLREGAHAARRAQRTSAQAAPDPEGALYDGLPLVPTSLTGVVDGELVIRGQPLIDWARHASLEETAALLWNTDVKAAFAQPAPTLPALWHSTARALRHTDPAVRATTLWCLAMPQLRGGVDLQGDELAAALGEHLRVAMACWLARTPSDEPLHLQVARAWRLPARTHDSLRQALVLCADMLGNLMSLSGRMMASVEGSLAACVLATMSYGFVRLSGGEFEAVETLFDEVEVHGGSLKRVAASYRARGETLPGVNHHVFVRGDPRGAALLSLATALGSRAGHWLAAAQDGNLLQPALDFGVVALRRALQAPRHAGLILIHAPRAAGMLAQAVEQRGHARRMWVQSRYVGPSTQSIRR